MHRYFAVDGSGLSHEDAQAIGVRLMALNATGEVTPKRVVEDARPSDAPTHKYFEWDDQQAANNWRESQAQYYMVNIYLAPEEDAPAQVTARNIRVECAPEPTNPVIVAPVIEMDEPSVAAALDELRRWQERYGKVYALRPVLIWVREAIRALAPDTAVTS